MSGNVRIADVQAEISEQHHERPLTFFRVRREWQLPFSSTVSNGAVALGDERLLPGNGISLTAFRR